MGSPQIRKLSRKDFFMTELSLQDHERDVEHARAKLAGDLAVLRSSETLSAFTNDLQHEAKSAAQSTVKVLLEDLKAKAATNPAAALAIGTGLAWRLIHNPAIASALVGVGLFSLWRTNAPRPPSGVRPDYLKQGKQRLKEQGDELLSKATEVAGDVQEILSTKATGLTDAAKDKAAQWANHLGEAVEEVGSRAQAKRELQGQFVGPSTIFGISYTALLLMPIVRQMIWLQQARTRSLMRRLVTNCCLVWPASQ
jgi:hypothetical protein